MSSSLWTIVFGIVWAICSAFILASIIDVRRKGEKIPAIVGIFAVLLGPIVLVALLIKSMKMK